MVDTFDAFAHWLTAEIGVIPLGSLAPVAWVSLLLVLLRAAAGCEDERDASS
jgi:hypothetical protein